LTYSPPKFPPTSCEPDPMTPERWLQVVQRIYAAALLNAMPEEGLQEAEESLVEMVKFYYKPEKKIESPPLFHS
jgi:hypothetical protein